jgi:hypothetical protein
VEINRLYSNTIGIIAGNIIAAIPMVQLIANIVTANGFRVIMASIISGCSIEKYQVMAEMEIINESIIF